MMVTDENSYLRWNAIPKSARVYSDTYKPILELSEAGVLTIYDRNAVKSVRYADEDLKPTSNPSTVSS